MTVGQSSMTQIDPRAVVFPGAELDEGVQIGPFSIIGSEVKLGRGTWVGPHAVIEGRTTMGAGNRVFQFASVGTVPQDLKYRGEDSELIMGDHNQVRECATIHRGTEGGGMVTRIGSGNLFMAYTHVAHDCVIGDSVIMANTSTLAGHVLVEDGAFLGGQTGVHQFCRIGSMSMLAAGTIVVMDVPPYATAQGDRARLVGLNLEGMKRKGVPAESQSAVKDAYRLIFRSGLSLDKAVAKVRSEVVPCPEVDHLLSFIAETKRGITR